MGSKEQVFRNRKGEKQMRNEFVEFMRQEDGVGVIEVKTTFLYPK